MAKLNLTDITEASGFSTTVNANNALIEAAIENTLSRDGTAPNFHDADVDMNSYQIHNLADGVALQDAVTVNQLTNGLQGVVVNSATLVGVTDTNNNYTGTTVEDILDEIAGLFLPLAGGTMTGAIVQAELTDYSITSTSPSSSSGSITLDYSASNAFQTTLTENITTVTLSNPPASGTYGEIIWKVVQDSTPRTITFPASVKWTGGTAPTISTGSGDVDIIVLKTWDGGTNWYGDYSQAYA